MINSHGISAQYIDTHDFFIIGNLTDVFLKGIRVKSDCGDDGFKYGTVDGSTWIPTSAGTMVTLDGIDSDHLTDNLKTVWYEEAPHMEDGRPIVRSDTRPINTQTYFTMVGDDTGIGDGKALRWDFSNADDIVPGVPPHPLVPNGYKAKEIKLRFNCPVHLKDGCIYFFDAPWGQHMYMDIMVPSGGYYPNPAGQIPAFMLGLPGNKQYAQATEDTVISTYVKKHFTYGSCPMGDELNAEGASVDALPIGWYLRGLIITPESDSTSKGFASMEMYRCHTTILPGVTSIH